MLDKETILKYKSSLEDFFINQKKLYSSTGLTSRIVLLNEVESIINEVYDLINDLDQEVNSHEEEYHAINSTANTLYMERINNGDNRVGFKPDDVKLKESFSKKINQKRNGIIRKIIELIESAINLLNSDGYNETNIEVNGKYVNVILLLERICTYAESITPYRNDIPTVRFSSSEDVQNKLNIINEFEERGITSEEQVTPTFISKLTKRNPSLIISGKEELLKIASLERKIKACEYALSILDKNEYVRVREMLMNFITRYQNELRFAHMKFERSDFEHLNNKLIITKEHDAREKRIFGYAGLYALYLEAVDNNDEEKMEECISYLETYQITEDELLEARIEGTVMYEVNKGNKVEQTQAKM